MPAPGAVPDGTASRACAATLTRFPSGEMATPGKKVLRPATSSTTAAGVQLAPPSASHGEHDLAAPVAEVCPGDVDGAAHLVDVNGGEAVVAEAGTGERVRDVGHRARDCLLVEGLPASSGLDEHLGVRLAPIDLGPALKEDVHVAVGRCPDHGTLPATDGGVVVSRGELFLLARRSARRRWTLRT